MICFNMTLEYYCTGNNDSMFVLILKGQGSKLTCMRSPQPLSCIPLHVRVV